MGKTMRSEVAVDFGDGTSRFSGVITGRAEVVVNFQGGNDVAFLGGCKLKSIVINAGEGNDELYRSTNNDLGEVAFNDFGNSIEIGDLALNSAAGRHAPASDGFRGFAG